MTDQIKELNKRIVEAEDLLDFMTRYQVPFSKAGFYHLFDELKSLRIELAEVENTERKNNHRWITCN